MLRDIPNSCNPKTNICIVGDVNVPNISWINGSGALKGLPRSLCLEKDLVQTLNDNFWHQHINFNTRFREHQEPSCLDLVITNDPSIVETLNQGTPLGKSDHITLRIHLRLHPSITPFTRDKFNFNRGDYAGFNNALKCTDWDQLNDYMEVDTCWNYLKGKIMTAAVEYIPKKSTRQTHKPAWLDKGTLTLIRQRNIAWHKYRFTKFQHHLEVYRRLRNNVTRSVHTARRRLEARIALDVKNAPKAFGDMLIQSESPIMRKVF